MQEATPLPPFQETAKRAEANSIAEPACQVSGDAQFASNTANLSSLLTLIRRATNRQLLLGLDIHGGCPERRALGRKPRFPHEIGCNNQLDTISRIQSSIFASTHTTHFGPSDRDRGNRPSLIR